MLIYIIAFFSSIFFMRYAETSKKNNAVNKLCIFIALLIPILLSGLRMIGVGTDTALYPKALYEAAKVTDNFYDYLNTRVYVPYRYRLVSEWEIGYNFLIFYTTKIFGSYQFILLVTHIIIIVLLYGSFKRFEGTLSKTYGVFVFYFLYYGVSLNAMRQWLAMAVILFGTKYLVENNDIKFFLSIVIAVLFHNSAIIGIIIWFVYKFCDHSFKYKKIKIGNICVSEDVYKVIVVFAVGITCILLLGIISEVLSLFGSRFSRYVKVYLLGEFRLLPMQIIKRLPMILLVMISWKRISKITNLLPFLFSMVIVDLIISQLGSFSDQSGRIGYYFSVYNIFLYPIIIKAYNEPKKKLIFLMISVFVIFTFYYDYYYNGWHEIIPYRFFTQN